MIVPGGGAGVGVGGSGVGVGGTGVGVGGIGVGEGGGVVGVGGADVGVAAAGAAVGDGPGAQLLKASAITVAATSTGMSFLIGIGLLDMSGRSTMRVFRHFPPCVFYVSRRPG